MTKRTIIDRNTLLPVSVLGGIIAAAVWMTMLFATANENSKKIAKLETKYEQTTKDLSDIKTSLTVIKTVLEIKDKEKDDE